MMATDSPTCSVVGCSNSELGMVESTVFYYAPQDASGSLKWARVLKGHIGNTPLPKALICLKHFKAEDLETKSLKLKKKAIPSIFPATKYNEPQEPPHKKFKPSDPDTLLKKSKLKESTEEVDTSDLSLSDGESSSDASFEAKPDFFNEEEIDEYPLNEECSINQEGDITEVDLDCTAARSSDNTVNSIHPDDDVDDILKKRIGKLKEFKEGLKEKYQKLALEDCTLNNIIASTSKEITTKDKELKVFPEYQQELLRKCFSPVQIAHMMGKSKARWSTDDLAMAYTICNMTTRSIYTYLKNEVKYPLPSLSNVNRIYRDIMNQTKAKEVNRQSSLDEAEDEADHSD